MSLNALMSYSEMEKIYNRYDRYDKALYILYDLYDLKFYILK